MSQYQLEREPASNVDPAAAGPQTAQGPAPGTGGPAHEGPPPAAAGHDAAGHAGGGAAGGAAGAWEADDGLMDAMGLGDDHGDQPAGEGEGGQGKATGPAQENDKARRGGKKKSKAGAASTPGTPGGGGAAHGSGHGGAHGGAVHGSAAHGGTHGGAAHGGAAHGSGHGGAAHGGAHGAAHGDAAHGTGDAAKGDAAGAKDAGGAAPLQRRELPGAAGGAEGIHETASAGISGSGGSLPHLGAIQHSFGHHDVSGVSAHTDGAAGAASRAMGAEAYATGNHVAFGSASPSLHTAAHEAAHVVQQRGGVQLKGGVGESGDSHERHADAVADRVVQGKTASDLLDQYAPSGGAAGGGVQHRLVQFDIKKDLRDTFGFWGNDVDKLMQRLQRATTAELQEVLADKGMLAQLKSELSRSNMEKVLDLLAAPLADKLRLAISGWTNDNNYIRHALQQAKPAELQAAANDAKLVSDLTSTLGRSFMNEVLDKLSVSLSKKLEYAMKGWGSDDKYILASIHKAPIADVTALAGDAAMLGKLDGELNASLQAQYRGAVARRVYLEAANADLAFSVLMSENDKQLDQRLMAYGSVQDQRALCDAVILAGVNARRVVRAFHLYWRVDMAYQNATKNNNKTTEWPIATLQAVHKQLKLLPEGDVRTQFWTKLTRSAGETGNYTGGSMGGGNFTFGDAITPGDKVDYGVGVYLRGAHAANLDTINVNDTAPFAAGATVALERGEANYEVVKIKSVDAAGRSYKLESRTTKPHGDRTRMTPDDATAAHAVSWLGAVVRHEIAHAVDTTIGGAKGFYDLGGWKVTSSFEEWAGAMPGGGWSTSDGSKISDADKTSIKNQIVTIKGTAGGKGLADGSLPGDPINTYWTKAVPVIEAAKAPAQYGMFFFGHPEQIYASGGKRFAVNHYYHNFQLHNEIVASARVRDYQLFAPAEFFAENYCVYYEQAGSVPDDQLGAMVPVGAWRDWIKNHVHNRGLAPTKPAPGAASPIGTAAVGKAAGNPGRT